MLTKRRDVMKHYGAQWATQEYQFQKNLVRTNIDQASAKTRLNDHYNTKFSKINHGKRSTSIRISLNPSAFSCCARWRLFCDVTRNIPISPTLCANARENHRPKSHTVPPPQVPLPPSRFIARNSIPSKDSFRCLCKDLYL